MIFLPSHCAGLARANPGPLSVSFDTAASRYHSGVYSRKRLELLSKLNSTLSPLFLSHLKNLHKLVLKNFRKSIQDGLKADGYDFAQVVKETTEKAEEEFRKGAKEVTLEETEWSSEETEGQLREDMVAIADLLRVEETKKMVAVIEVCSFALRCRVEEMLTPSFGYSVTSRSKSPRRSS